MKIIVINYFFFISIILNFSFCDRHQKEEWRSHTVYQILTDRFAKDKDDTLTDCNDLSKYCGGTFNGIKENLDYITGMGFDSIWISPPLKNKENSFHGYHNIDLYSINEHFGSSEELTDLIKECHKRDIWVILDAVPNHMSGDLDISTFIPFNKSEHYHQDCDVNENSNQEEIENCRIWGMPDLNQSNLYVEETLLNWLEEMITKYGFDGVRYADVANVPKWFWGEFTEKANTYTLGIVSGNNATYIADYQRFMDGVGDYPLYYAIRKGFCDSMLNLKDYYENTHGKYISPQYNGIWLGNHDNPRFLFECQNDKRLLRNAIIFTLFYEGIPIFYYGDEQYFNGGNDPQNREVMFGRHNTSSDVYKLIKTAIDIRKSEKIYEQNLSQVYADAHAYAFTRGKVLIIVSNVEDTEISLSGYNFKHGDIICNKLENNDCITVSDAEIKIKMTGEPKIYILNSDKDNNGSTLKIYKLKIISLVIYFMISFFS